jgi:hypothetical protein
LLGFAVPIPTEPADVMTTLSRLLTLNYIGDPDLAFI